MENDGLMTCPSDSFTKSYSSVNLVSNIQTLDTKLYPRRFGILLVFCLGLFCNAYSFAQYSVVTDVMSSYYDVSSLSINMTGIVYTVGFIIAMVPAIALYETKGLKVGIVVGLAGNALGSCVKCAGATPGYFYIAMIGQSILAVSQTCFLTLTPFVASVWFGPDEVSTAGAAGILSNCLGIAISSVVAPYIVYGNDKNLISRNFSRQLYVQAGVAFLVLLTAFFVLKEKPEKPPSLAQVRSRIYQSVYEIGVVRSMLDIAKNKNLILLSIAFSVNYAVLCTLSTLLNQMILNVYGKSASKHVGFVILSLQFANVFGAISAGVLLDKTKRYKTMAYGMYIISFICVAIFTGVIYTNITAVYIICGLVGFFVGGFITIGLDLVTEMSYPASEVCALGLAGIIGNAISLIYMISCGVIIEVYGELVTNLVLVGGFIVGFALLAFSKIQLNRLEANRSDEDD